MRDYPAQGLLDMSTNSLADLAVETLSPVREMADGIEIEQAVLQAARLAESAKNLRELHRGIETKSDAAPQAW